MIANNSIRYIIGIGSAVGLTVIFLFQGIDAASLFNISGGTSKFIFNRTIRFLLNDAFAISLIYALFGKQKYVIFSIWVQLFGVVMFLVPYFILKIQFPKYNGPLISYLHRLILNPTILLLLIPAFYYQRKNGVEN
jgi:exosortase F-associated protein